MSDSIFEHKNLIFEHVLYEIEMYLFTNILLGRHQTDQLLVNVLWTSNLTYMRNLIGFFSDEPGYDTDITYRTVLNDIDTLGIDKKTVAELMKIINKSISHLTKDRISNDYVTDANIEIEKIKPILYSKIQGFIDSIPDNVNDTYSNELKHEHIIGLLKTVRDLIRSIA